MSVMKIQEINVETGENIVRDGTPEEIAKWEESRQRKEAVRAELAEAQAKREAALSKLAALGLTTDDLKALGL